MKCILFLFVFKLLLLEAYAQIDTLALKKRSIEKLQSIYQTSDVIYAEIYGPDYFNVVELFYGLSSRYKIQSTSLTYHHYNGPNLVYVWDNKRSCFLDTVTVGYFNRIIGTSSITLNSLEKSVLYLNIVYNITVTNYYLNGGDRNIPMFPQFTIRDMINHKYKDGCCTYWDSPNLLDYTCSSSDTVVYLPYTFQKDEQYFYSFRRFHYSTRGELAKIEDMRSNIELPIKN